jgi:hypothetical protein
VVLTSPSRTAEPAGADTVAHDFPARRRRRSRRPVVAALSGLAVLAVLAAILPSVLSSGGRDAAPEPVGGPPGVPWKLRLDENFSGTTDSLLGSGTWHSGWFGDGTLTGAVNSAERSLLSRSNITVAGGVATFDVTPNPRRLALPDGTTRPDLGATINSDDAQAPRGFLIGYGYVEARMQLPAAGPAEGVWPSFWLNGHTWPDDMEIDVVEGDGTDDAKYNVHYGRGHDTTNLNDGLRTHVVPGATTGMHTYAVDIRPDGLTFYYDGAVVHEYHGTVPDAQRYIMLGVSSSGTVRSPHTLLVDYVRAWSRG